MKEEKVFKDMEKAYRQKASGFSESLGCTVKATYGPEDIADFDISKEVGKPGEYPFTRGLYPDMYRGKLWTMRSLVGFGTPEDTRERVKQMAKLGTGGINIIVDGPTLNGLDPDHALAEGEVGVVGIPFTTLKDMEAFLDGIPIESISSSVVVTTCVAPIIFAQFIAAAQKRGIDIKKLRGTIQNNPIKDFYCSHQLGSSHMDLCLKTCGDVYEYCVKYMPKWNPTNVNMGSFIMYGLTAPLEVAIGFGIALAELEEQLERGLDIDDVAPRMAFMCLNNTNIFEHVAKFRAMRRMWAKFMKEKYGAKNPKSWKLRFASETGTHTLYPQEPLNNIVRLTLEALSLVLSGTQSMFACGYDEPIALPNEESMRLSLRIQQIIAHESGVANTADPLGGSYYVEWLTKKIEDETNNLLGTLESKGGITSHDGAKWVRDQIDSSIWQNQQRIRSGELIKVAVNAFIDTGAQDVEPEVHRHPEGTAAAQLERLRKVRKERDGEKVKRDLEKLRNAAEKKDRVNLMPFILEAVKGYASVGEIFGTIRQAYGYDYDPASEAGSLY